MLEREIIVFDFETNGFNGTSVLSLSAIKAKVLEDELVEVERFNRFYYRTPGENENPAAIEINGLTTEIIKESRGDAEYSEHYIDDIHSFIEFCGDTDHFIAHNFSFDRDFVGFETLTSFCTFIEARNINIGKYNKLSDLAKYYGIEVKEENLHSSMYDVELLFDITRAMYKEKNDNLLKFFKDRALNKKEQKYIQVRFNSYLKSKREQKERFVKMQETRIEKKDSYREVIKRLSLPNYDITITQFLNSLNKALEEMSIKPISPIELNLHLKNKKILDGKNKVTTLGENSENYGIYSAKREREDTSYEVILYNSKGKETLKNEVLNLLENK
ncbi:MAG: 3'-5' exonuclease [Fusobacteriaceae bacterium]